VSQTAHAFPASRGVLFWGGTCHPSRGVLFLEGDATRRLLCCLTTIPGVAGVEAILRFYHGYVDERISRAGACTTSLAIDKCQSAKIRNRGAFITVFNILPDRYR